MWFVRESFAMSNALAQLLSIAEGEPVADWYGGSCVDCGRSMYRKGHLAQGKPRGWVCKGAQGKCMSCYQRKRRRERGHMPRRSAALSHCVVCRRSIRYADEPATVGELVRSSLSTCRSCIAPRPDDPVACSLCARRFGSTGPLGGRVRLGIRRSGVCTTCRDRESQRRKRGRAKDGAG